MGYLKLIFTYHYEMSKHINSNKDIRGIILGGDSFSKRIV